ncbi:MAG: hypothetical protein M1815_002888 [Lichina confinis]|nr:MAG: hypothetical protein M1815_002888 [Lichina confinis]
MKLGTSLLLQLWSTGCVYAFRDTSPLFYFSTTESAEHLRSRGLPPLVSSSESVQLHIEEQLSTCSSDTYILVSQPGVNAADFKTASAAPHLRRYMTGGEGEDSRSPTASFHVPDVLGHFDLVWAESYLERTCGAEIMNVDASTGVFKTVDDMKPRVVRLDFPRLPPGPVKRTAQLQENDAFLSSLIDLLPSSRFTVLYTTTSEYEDVDHLPHREGSLMSPDHYADSGKEQSKELKRRMLHRRDDGDNKNGTKDGEDKPKDDDKDKKGDDDKDKNGDDDKNDDDDEDKQPDTTLVDGPLFQRYQFLSPGFGVRALGSLEVSYGAFEKKMGPAGQMKQQ